MELSAREDIEAPIDFVFQQVTDFPHFERILMRRGADVDRVKGDGTAILDSVWDVRFRMRGKERQLTTTLSGVDAPNGMVLDINSKNLDGVAKVDLVALSRARTRLNVHINLDPKTLQARLLFQSLRFARAKTTGRFSKMVAVFAEDVEARYRD